MDTELSDDIKFINKFLYAVQKHRIALGNWIDSKVRSGTNPSKRAMKLYQALETQETQAKNIAREIISEHPLWPEFFNHIRGVGESLATSLIAEIKDISKFDTVSSLQAYSALTTEYVKANCSKGHKLIMASDKHRECPVYNNENEEPCGGEITIIERIKGSSPKRVKGHHYLFNSKLKTIFWKISEQMIKQGNAFYRDVYDRSKQYYSNKAASEGKIVLPAAALKTKKDKTGYISEGHIHNMAKRKMVKLFLSHLWDAWRELEGLPTRPPYVIEKLNHKGYMPWSVVREILREEKEANKAV